MGNNADRQRDNSKNKKNWRMIFEINGGNDENGDSSR